MGSKLANMSMRHGSSVVGGPTLAQQKVDIGSREIVGYGANGEVTYIDSVMAPFPAIRFKEDVGEIAALREKEKGEWKSVLGLCLIGISIGIWGYMWMKKFVYSDLPDTITDEEKVKAQIDRMIAIRVNPVEGLTSNYDYEKGEWKKK